VTAEGALRDYASMAAWEFSRVSQENLGRFVSGTFDDLPYRRRSRDLPSLETVIYGLDATVRRQRCDCPALRNPIVFYRINLIDSTALVRPDTGAVGFVWRIADAVLSGQHVQDNGRDGLVAHPRGAVLEAPALSTYAVLRDRGGTPQAIYGFVTPPDAYEELLGRWFDRQPLLPPAIAGVQPNDSLLFVTVRSSTGERVFESSVPYAMNYAASDSTGSEYGDLLVEAALRPDAANHLIIGGLPRSRLPLIVALLVLTLATGAAALIQLRREQQLARLRQDFVSGVSHELRTPLAQIRMFAELLDTGKLRTDAERDRSTRVINREARRLTHLVEKILQFSRLERATVDLRVEQLDAAQTIAEVIEAFKPLAVARDARLVVDVEDGLAVRADRDAVSQLLLNLLDNAVKYGPKGQTVTVTGVREGNNIRLSVEDEGPGIAPHDRDRIWEPYHRLEREVNGEEAGSGIGLALVDELAAQHGGRSWVEDTASGGARFVVELPGGSTTQSGAAG
jgi:signal transduction histidine kinase